MNLRLCHILLLNLFMYELTYTKAIAIKQATRSQSHEQPIDPRTLEISLQTSGCKDVLLELLNEENAFQFIRFAQCLKEEDKSITLQCPVYLKQLFSWCPYIDRVISQEETVSYDLKLSLEQLASYYMKRIQINDSAPPYLFVDELISTLWQETFARDVNYKIGICCALTHGSSDLFCTSIYNLQDFLPIACMQDISLYSFDAIDKIDKAIPEQVRVYYMERNLKEHVGDLAAVIHFMDLIITTNSFVAQLAGALGKPVWFIITDQLNIDHTAVAPWYPSIKLFQSNKSDKNAVIFDIMHKLMNGIKKPAESIVTAEIATGELIDKMTILEIKTERISNEEKLENVWRELHSLRHTFEEFVTLSPELEQLFIELKAANEALWETEDLIRDKEREKCFDEDFIQLARRVYQQNDKRCEVKRKINKMLGSRIIEEKSYKPY